MTDFLLLRGWAREQRHWGEFPAVLQSKLGAEGRVIGLDLPGFGTEHKRLSPFRLGDIVEDLRYRWKRAHANRRAYVVGISLGGMIALDWAKLFPNDWHGVTVINSSIADYSKPWERLFLSNIPLLKRALLEKDAHVRERLILKMTTNWGPVKIEELAKDWAGFAAEFPVLRRNILAQLLAASRFRLGPPPAVDTLILASRHDHLVNPKCSEAFAKKANIPIQWHLEAGHDITLEDPSWAADRILAWTKTHSGVHLPEQLVEMRDHSVDP